MKPKSNPFLRSALLSTAALGLCSSAANAAIKDWNPPVSGSGGSVTWATGTNWTGGSAPTNDLTTDIARFNQTSYNFQPNYGTTSVNGIIVGDGTTAVGNLTLSGTTLSIGASGIDIKANAGTVALNNAVKLGASQTWTNNSGSLFTVGATVTNVANLTPYILTIDGTGNTTMSGAITNGGATGTTGITKNGSGTLTLEATNTFTGGLIINAGTVKFGKSSVFNSLGSGNVTIGGSGNTVIDFVGSNATLSTVTGWTLTGAGTINRSNSLGSGIGWGTAKITGSSGGLIYTAGSASAVIQVGAVTSDYTGGTTLTSGTIVMNGTNNADTSTAGTFGNGSVASNVVTFNGASLRGGSTTATRTIYNNISFAADTTLAATSGGAAGTLTWAGEVTLNGTGTVRKLTQASATQDWVFSNTIKNGTVSDFTVNITNTKSVTLSGANTFNGTLLASGTGGGSLALGNVNAVQNATLDTGTSTGSRAVTFTVAGNNTYNIGALAGSDALAIGGNTISVGAKAADTIFNADISGAGGGLTKVGSNKLTLTAATSYSGATQINNGTLALTGSGTVNGSSGITIDGTGIIGSTAKFLHAGSTAVSPTVTLTNGTFTGSGTVNTVNVGAGTGGIISNNDGVAGAALTITSLNLAGGASINLYSNTTAAALNVTTFTNNSTSNAVTITANNVGGWTNGSTYNIIDYGTLGGSGAYNFNKVVNNKSARQSETWADDTVNGIITLTLNGDTPRWMGDGDDKWNLASTNNWRLVNGGGYTTFLATDDVLFDDNATGTTSIDIDAADVAANTTVFNNSTAKSYTLGSTGGFGISTGSLTKNNTGSVTISTNNSYTGTTTLNNGILRATTSANALGLGSLIITGGELQLANDSGLNFARNTTVSGNAQITSDTLTAVAGVTQTLGTLDIGANTLTIAKGANATGTTAGITFGSTTLSGASTFSIGAGSTLTLGSVTNGANTATITGAGNFAQTGVWGNGSGGLTFDSSFSGTATMNQANTYTGATAINAGKVRATSNTGALGAGTLTLAGGELQLANDSGLNFGRNTTVTGNAQITSDTLTAAGGVTHTLGTLSIGANTLSIAKGSNATGTTARVAFGATTLTGASTFSIGSGSTLSLAAVANGVNTAVITGAGNFAQTGVWSNGSGGITFDSGFSGTATLSQANTYSGGTTISGGTVVASVTGGLGTGSVTNNAILNLTAGAVTYTGLSTGMSGGGTANVTLGTGDTTTMLSGNYSAFTGIWNIGVSAAAGAGKAQFSGLDNASATINVLSNGTVYTNTAGTRNASIVLNGGDTGESLGQLRLEAGAIWAGSVTLAGAITGTNDGIIGSNNGTGTISGQIGETGGSQVLSKVGGGKIVLTNSNNYTGLTNVIGGVLAVEHANALGTTAAGTSVTSGASLEVSNGVTVNSGETITINGAGASSFGALRAGTGNGTWAGQVTIGDTSARLGALAGRTLTVTGSIVNGVGTGIVISGESGTGTVVLNPTGTNTYSGTTGIVRGILQIGKTDALPTGTVLDVDSVGGVGDAAVFDMAGFNQTVVALQDTATSNISGKVTNSLADSTSILTVNQAVTTDFAGVIENGASGTGKVQVTKDGVGTLTLRGVNTYTGDTTVTTGTLALAGSGSIANSAKLVVNGTLDVSGITAGTFTVGGTQTLSGTGTVNATGKTLEIVGTHAVGNSAGVQTVTATNLSYAAGSIFEWGLAANVENGTWDHDNNVGTAAINTRGSAFDAVNVTGNLVLNDTANTGAVFKVILGEDFDGSSAFWTANRSWDVFNVTGTNTTPFTNFKLFNASDLNTEITSATYSPFGSFGYSFASNTGTLTWTAVPEFSNVLIGGLLGVGLLRRRRK